MSSPEAISYIALLAFGPAIGVFVLRQSLPSLPTFARAYAVFLFVACIALLVAHTLIRIPPYYDKVLWVDRWLWNVKHEYSIPTTFATLQLAIIALLAILTALSAKSKPAWRRLYFLAFGILFIYLALDEYYLLHEANELLYGSIYAGIGAIIVLAALRVLPRSRARGLLLSGLALAAAGGLGIDLFNYNDTCLRFLPSDACFAFKYLEEGLEMLGMCLTLLAMLEIYCEVKPKPRPMYSRLLFATPLLLAVMLPVSVSVRQYYFDLHEPPWRLINPWLLQTRENLLGLAFGVRHNTLDNSQLVFPWHFYGQLGSDTQYRSTLDIDGRIGDNKLETPGYWILFQRGVTEPTDMAIVEAILDEYDYEACDMQTFPNSADLYTYRWKSLRCDALPKTIYDTDVGAYWHYGARHVETRLLLTGAWQRTTDADPDAHNISFQLIDADWRSHAQIDLPTGSLSDMRQFVFELADVPAGDYRLMAVTYDSRTGERQAWQGNEDWIPEMQPLAEIAIPERAADATASS
ncbi:MAG: hypothetical protein OXE95_02810 [Chloroflexi bacterium]|nr:hypothetical protein [Chloroflexota bacterium]MCY4246493.1 hypothetical protein [Chloroflexota bacterium]